MVCVYCAVRTGSLYIILCSAHTVYLSKISQTSNFLKIHQVSFDLFHVDRQTDMTKLKVTFRNSANGPKMSVKPETCEGMNRIRLAQGMTFVGMIMNLQVF